MSKCPFFKKHLQYLGHFVSGEGIYLLREIVACLVNLTPPTDMTETRHIIGLVSYYRKVMEKFSDIMTPLNDLTRKMLLLFGAHHVK